jgi:DGQHR domain-containing protein
MLTIADKEPGVMRHGATTGSFTPPRTIDVVMGPKLKSGTRIVTGFMPAGAMIPDRCEIPYFNHTTKQGYQRPAQEPRISQLAGELRRNRTDLPTAVLLNIRNRNAQDAVGDGQLDLGMLQSTTPLTSKFYVVDGQHRVLALKKLLEENFDDWAPFLVPFVCMLGANEDEEMNQFYIVNSTSKSVRTDLALSLLKKRVDEDPTLREELQKRGREWQVDGQTLVERLTNESPVWRDRIRFPDGKGHNLNYVGIDGRITEASTEFSIFWRT